MADSPRAAPRKRVVPLAENTEHNMDIDNMTTHKTVQKDDSPPKRSCVRSTERDLKPDTPAVPSVRSRMAHLVEDRQHWNEENGCDDLDVAPPPKPPRQTSTEPEPVIPNGRRGRLAALASNINNWEEDLDHPKSCRPAEEKPKRNVWQPPPKPSDQASKTNAKPNIWQPPSKSGQEVSKPVNKALTTVQRSPIKPPRTFDQSATPLHSSPSRKQCMLSIEKVKSPMKAKVRPQLTPGGSTPEDEAIERAIADCTHLSDRIVDTKETIKQKAQRSTTPKTQNAKPRKNNDEEPTAVTAIMSVWQQKTASPNQKTGNNNSISSANRKPVSSSNSPKPQPRSTKEEYEPTKRSVHSRMAMWEQTTLKNVKEYQEWQKTSPVKKACQSPLKTQGTTNTSPSPATRVSNVKSPAPVSPMANKVSSQMKAVQSRLLQQTEKGWKDNEIAAKIQRQRQEEMKTIQNRWKNGVLNEEERNDTEEENIDEVDNNVQTCKPPTPKRQRNPSKEKEQNVSQEEEEEFEGKLSAMGFEVASTVDLKGKKGHSAVVTLQRGQDQTVEEPKAFKRQKIEVESMPPPPQPVQKHTRAQPVHDSFYDETFISRNQRGQPSSNSRLSITSTVSTDSQESVLSTMTSGSEDMVEAIVRQTSVNSTSSERYSEQDDDEDSDDEEATAAIAEIDDLLDEAMDEEEEVAPPVVARQQTYHRNRKQQAPAVPRSQVKSAPVYRAESLESMESEEEGPLQYSVSFYRATQYKSNGPEPKMTIVRDSKHTAAAALSEPSRYIPQQDEPKMSQREAHDKIKQLQELINQEQNVILQTSNALNQCCTGNSSFAGSLEQVECNKLLLVACQKRQAYLEEIQKLKNGPRRNSGGKCRGSLTISDIRLPLKKDFCSKIGTRDDISKYYFLCMIRNGAHVIVTQMVSTHDPMVRGSLDFPNLIKINDIQDGFQYNLEIYTMSISQEIQATMTPTSKKKDKYGSLRGTPKKLLGFKNKASAIQSPGGPMAVRSTQFNCLASLPITRRALQKTSFTLEKIPFLCPLQGTVHLKLRCMMEINIEERGFLSMFDEVGGFGAWHRRWCALSNNMICYWKYPDDERNKDPIGVINLKHCVTDNVGIVSRDVCARPNTFELCTVKSKAEERTSLTTKYYSNVATTQHLLSADVKEDRVVWCNKLNEALKNLRAWHPDALRPIDNNKKPETAC